jgi:hypothetical protein
MHGLLRPTGSDHSLQLYAMAIVAHIPWSGVGECVALKVAALRPHGSRLQLDVEFPWNRLSSGSRPRSRV